MLLRLNLLCLLVLAMALPAGLDAQRKPRGLKKLKERITGEESNDKDSKYDGPGVAGPRYPSISPDGKHVAFALHGDLWVIPADGGRATRITLNEANDIKPVWSPDSKQLAFTSDRSGGFDIYTMPAEGGVPTRLTFDGGTDHISEWSDDGKYLIFQSTREELNWRLYRVPVEGGTPELLTLDAPATDGDHHGESGWLYYNRSSSDGKVKAYRGSMNDELYRCMPGEIPERLTDNDQNDREPNISADGTTLYFTRETGEMKRDYNLFAMNVETRDVQQLTSLDENGMSYVSFSSDFSQAYFVWKFRIYRVNLNEESAKPELVAAHIIEDTRRPKEIERTATNGAASCDVSADGEQLTFELGGAIWVMNASGGKARQITATGSGDHMPRWAPDSNRIAFYSSRAGNDDLFVINANGSGLRQLTFDASPDHFHNWSHDGTYIVFSSDRAGNREIYKVGLDGSSPERLTRNGYSDDDPSVSPDGRYIAYDSWPSGNADIFIMDADGENVRRVYGTVAQEESPRFSPDGRLLVFNRTSLGGIGVTREVVVTDLAGSGEVVVANGYDGQFTPDGKEIVYVDEDGHIKAVPAPTDVSGGRTIPFMASETVPQKDMFLRAFDEAWKLVADNFYVADFHGVNWNAVRQRYRPMVAQCKTRMEYYFYMTQMIGELSASHQGIYGPISDLDGFSTGLLGCEVTPQVMEDEDGEESNWVRLQVHDVEKGGAADQAWLREGDYIFGVAGRRLEKGLSFAAMLKDTAGKTVTLIVGTEADGSNMRAVQVTPEGRAQTMQRRYINWVRKCKTTTQEEGDGDVAYIHIPQMDGRSLMQFQNELGSPQVQAAKALVLDVRNNGGGNIHQQLFDILSRKHYAINFSRGQQGNAPALFWDRPIVLLINTSSYSDAEVFPHGFRELGLGTIVGEPTPGAVIGTINLPLSDGSTFRVTRVGFRNLDGTNQEGNGVQPDVLVEMTAEDRIKDRDPQLKRAIEIALEDIERAKQAKRQEILERKQAREAREAAEKEAAEKAEAEAEGKEDDGEETSTEPEDQPEPAEKPNEDETPTETNPDEGKPLEDEGDEGGEGDKPEKPDVKPDEGEDEAQPDDPEDTTPEGDTPDDDDDEDEEDEYRS